MTLDGSVNSVNDLVTFSRIHPKFVASSDDGGDESRADFQIAVWARQRFSSHRRAFSSGAAVTFALPIYRDQTSSRTPDMFCYSCYH